MREQLERAVVKLASGSGFPAASLRALDDNLAEQLSTLRARDEMKMFELDEAFHRAIFAGCNKLNTWNLLQQAKTHLDRARHLALGPDRDWRHLYNQHRKIAEAIRSRDAEAADLAMQEHLQQTVTDLNELKQQMPHYFKP